MINVFATISVQSGGKDGWIPRVDQQASTSPKQTVSNATSGCFCCFFLVGFSVGLCFDGWLVGCLVVSTEGNDVLCLRRQLRTERG